MFPFFLVLSHSAFISFSKTKTLTLKPLNASDLSAIIANTSSLVILAGTADDKEVVPAFIRAQHLFPEFEFVVAPPSAVKANLNRSRPKPPYLALFQRQKPFVVVGPIDGEETLVTMLDLYITRTRPTLVNFAEMVQALGAAPRTISGPSSIFNSLLEISRMGSTSVGPTDVLSLSPELAGQLGLGEKNCSIYRRDDEGFDQFPCNLRGFSISAIPTFSRRIGGLKKSRQHVVALYTRPPEAAKSAAEVLWELGTVFRDFRFVFLSDAEKSTLTQFLPTFGDNVTDVAIVNFTGGYAFNLSHFFTSEMRLSSPFDAKLWGNKVLTVCQSIRANTIPKIYRSEAVPRPMRGNLQRIVGETWKSVVFNETRDVLVLMLKQKCVPCTRLFEHFRRLASSVEKTANSSYVFAFIDVKGNQIEGGFPVSVAPALALYPMGNKSDVKLLPYESFATLAWFARRYATQPHAVEADWPTEEEIARAEGRVAELSKTVGPRMAKVLEGELADLKEDVARARVTETAVGKERVGEKATDAGDLRDVL
jgi:hypothetical protein